MKTPVLVVASAYGADFVRQVGHAHLIPIVAAAGAAGLEIRRELFVDLPDFDVLHDLLIAHRLFSVYSAPIELFRPDGALARAELDQVMWEAKQLRSRFVKVALGHFSPQSNMLEWARFVAQAPVPVLLENDQTMHGGQLDVIASFLALCSGSGMPLGMTFDMGNWRWSGVDAEAAARTLAGHVQYVHCKGVRDDNGQLRAVPLEEDDAGWRRLFSHFPRGVQRAIEFPLVGQDLEAVTRDYVNMLASA
jgi:sugar phosphate isomerase/epimerase